MKISTLAFLLLSFVYATQQATGEERNWDSAKCEYFCPSGPSHALGYGPDGVTACDPSFICFDRIYPSLKQTSANMKGTGLQNGRWDISAEAEQSLAKVLDEAKTPDQAWALAAEVWKSRVSAEFQRRTLAQVRSMAKPSSDVETANFMLSALENPVAEMDRCREWGRGTALERKKAAERLALLLQNPNLADRLK